MAYNTFPPIITNGLVFCLDAANNKSYPGIGLNWYDLKTVTPNVLTNGAYYAPWNDGAIDFDGLSDYVKLNDVNIGTVGSWSIWINARAFSGVIVGSNIANYYMVYNDGSQFYINYGGAFGSLSYTLSKDVWHNIVCVRNGNSHQIFVDGVSVGTMTISTTNDSIFSIIGDETTSSLYPFNGKVSSFLIYDRVLSSDEVEHNYNAIKFRYFNNNTFPSITTSDLVLNLDAGDLTSYSGTGTTWYDLTANSYDGTLTNGASFSSIDANNMGFDGVDDFVELGDVLDMGTYSYTINTWVKISATSSDQWFFSKGLSGTQNYRYAIGFNSSSQKLWAFMQGNGGSDVLPYGSTTIPTYQWFMATYVYDRSSNIKIYYNGVLEALTGSSAISSWNGLDFQSNNPARVGAYTSGDNTTPISTIDGKIAISQIYRRALPASEILYNYNITKWRFLNDNLPPVAPIVTDQLYLSLDAADVLSYPGSGTTWYDLTANSHNATLTNGAYYDPSDSGVMVFDGVDDYANVGSLGSGFGIFTLDMWANSGSVTDYKNIIDFNGGNTMLRIEQYTSPGYYATWVNFGAGRARLSINLNVSGDFSFGFGGDCPGVITDNTWYNLVVTYDGTNCSIYINNQKLVNSQSVTGGFVGYINNMRIGDGYDYSSRRFQGKIPVVRIYKKSLSDSEVLQNYNAQKSRYGL